MLIFEKLILIVVIYLIVLTFLISGEAGKFSLVPLLINIGSGMALLGLV